MEDKPVYGTSDAGQLLGISQTRVVDLIRDGTLPAYKIGREWAILKIDIEKAKSRPVNRGGRPRKKDEQKK